MKKLLALALSVCFCGITSQAVAHDKPQEPLLIIGASFANGTTPFNDALNAPLGGISVGFGSYLSLGDALVRERRLTGHVINEAQGGATTFDRIVCNPACDDSVSWQSYDKQLTKALARVTMRDANGDIVSINAKHVIIAMPNDCLHSDAFGVPQDEATPCTTDDINASIDRMIAVGQRVIDLGLTPIFPIPPKYEQLDLPYFQSAFGLNWAADKANYDELTTTRVDRIAIELPDAVQLDAWKRFTHLGDGIHPDRKSVKSAARIIARFIRKDSRQN